MAWWHELIGGKNHFPKIEYVIKPAFTVKGREFFQMDDLFNMPYERGTTCLRYYTEFNMRVDREFLMSHTKAMNELLLFMPGKSIDLVKIKQLNDQLSDRLTWIMDGDLAYKLASVVFFDKHEDPTKYDAKYNQDKIAFWKKEMAAKEFFFMMPLQQLIPFLKDYEKNLETYLMVTDNLKNNYQENILQVLSKN